MELGKRPFACCESFNNVKKPSKKKIVQQNVKGQMADAYSYILGELLCALLPLFVDEVLRNTNKKMLSKWSHQNILAHFLVLTRPKCLLFSNERKRVNIGQTRLPSTRAIPLYMNIIKNFENTECSYYVSLSLHQK